MSTVQMSLDCVFEVPETIDRTFPSLSFFIVSGPAQTHNTPTPRVTPSRVGCATLDLSTPHAS